MIALVIANRNSLDSSNLFMLIFVISCLNLIWSTARRQSTISVRWSLSTLRNGSGCFRSMKAITISFSNLPPGSMRRHCVVTRDSWTAKRDEWTLVRKAPNRVDQRISATESVCALPKMLVRLSPWRRLSSEDGQLMEKCAVRKSEYLGGWCFMFKFHRQIFWLRDNSIP